jgi:hypothetical protein
MSYLQDAHAVGIAKANGPAPWWLTRGPRAQRKKTLVERNASPKKEKYEVL